MNLRAITHLDTFAVLVRLYKVRLEIPEAGLMVLREGDDSETSVWKDWKSLQQVVTKARKAIGSPEDLGGVWIERLRPGAETGW